MRGQKTKEISFIPMYDTPNGCRSITYQGIINFILGPCDQVAWEELYQKKFERVWREEKARDESTSENGEVGEN